MKTTIAVLMLAVSLGAAVADEKVATRHALQQLQEKQGILSPLQEEAAVQAPTLYQKLYQADRNDDIREFMAIRLEFYQLFRKVESTVKDVDLSLAIRWLSMDSFTYPVSKQAMEAAEGAERSLERLKKDLKSISQDILLNDRDYKPDESIGRYNTILHAKGLVDTMRRLKSAVSRLQQAITIAQQA